MRMGEGEEAMSDTTNRVRLRDWLWVIGLTVLVVVVVLGSAYAEQSSGAERGDLGYITKGTNLCHTDTITPYTIDSLEQWAALMERLEAAGGAIFLSAEDNELGQTLGKWCSTLAEGYPVVVGHEDGEYALIFWDRKLGFGVYPFIIRLRDFQEGGLRL